MMKIEKNYYNSILIFNTPPRPLHFSVIDIYITLQKIITIHILRGILRKKSFILLIITFKLWF